MLDANIKAQLQSYFTKLRRPIVLKAALDGSQDATNIEALLKEVAELSDKISYEVESDASVRRPSFTVAPQGGHEGIRFACLPMGHEFTSFVLALLQTGGHPAKISDEESRQIAALKGPLNFEVFISLSCHNCPEVVQALDLISILNPNATVTVIDGALFREEAAGRNVMAVPTVFLNGQSFLSGRRELSEILAKLDTSVAEAAQASISAKAPFDVLVVGGQVNETADIENFTSILKTDGTALAGNFTAHLKSYDIDIITPHSVAKIEREGDMWRLVLENGSELRSKTIIAASGARWKQLEVPGVAYCPHCDGPLFKGKRVAVVGGGNSGVEAAIDLAGIASSVVLLQRGSELTADKVLQEKLLSLPNVTVKYRASTSKLTGSNKLEKLFYLNRETGETESIDVDGCFVQIGLKPNTEWLDGAVELNAYGEVAVSDRCTTSAPGLFAAGDCTSVPYKQIVIALGEGAKAPDDTITFSLKGDGPAPVPISFVAHLFAQRLKERIPPCAMCAHSCLPSPRSPSSCWCSSPAFTSSSRPNASPPVWPTRSRIISG